MSWPAAPAPDPYITDPSFSIHIVGRNPYCEVSVQLATQVWSRPKYKYLMLHYLRSCRCLCTRMSVLSLISPTQRRYLDTSRYVHHSFLDARVSVEDCFFRVSLDLLLFFWGLWSLKSEYRKYDKSLPCSHKVRAVHLSKRMKNLTKPLRDICAKGDDCLVETDQWEWRDGDIILTRE